MKYKKNVISNLVLHILAIVIGFITSVIIARGLGPERQGLFAFILLIFGLISSYGHLGIISSNGYFMKKSSFSKDKVLNTNVSILILLSCIYLLLIILFKARIFDSNLYVYSIIWFLYAISLLFTTFFTTLYVIDEKIYVFNYFSMAINILKGVILVLLYFTNTLSLLSISVAYSFIEILKLVVVLFNLKIKYSFEISKEVIKKELKYGFTLYMAALLIYLNYRADLFMIKNMLGETDLGVYSIAVRLAELAFIFPAALTTAFEGKLYTCEENERKIVTSQTIKISFYITLIVCIIGILCRPLVKVLYGAEYLGAGSAMVFLLIGIIFASIGKVAPAYYYTMGKPNVHMVVSLMVLIINILCNYFLIPRYEINGAAIASSISYTFYGLVYIFMLSRSGISIKEIFRVSKRDIVAIKEQLFAKKRKRKEL